MKAKTPLHSIIHFFSIERNKKFKLNNIIINKKQYLLKNTQSLN